MWAGGRTAERALDVADSNAKPTGDNADSIAAIEAANQQALLLSDPCTCHARSCACNRQMLVPDMNIMCLMLASAHVRAQLSTSMQLGGKLHVASR